MENPASVLAEAAGQIPNQFLSAGEVGRHGGQRPPQGQQRSRGGSFNYSVTGRPLLRPEEVLTLSDNYLIAFQRGLPAPVLARRIRWYRDAAFNPAVGRGAALAGLGLLAAAVALMVWAANHR